MYRSPEQAEAGFTEKSLTYALGVVIFFMISGELPFYECPTSEEEADLKLEGKVWSVTSEKTKELIGKLLAFDSRLRPDIEDLYCAIMKTV